MLWSLTDKTDFYVLTAEEILQTEAETEAAADSGAAQLIANQSEKQPAQLATDQPIWLAASLTG